MANRAAESKSNPGAGCEERHRATMRKAYQSVELILDPPVWTCGELRRGLVGGPSRRPMTANGADSIIPANTSYIIEVAAPVGRVW